MYIVERSLRLVNGFLKSYGPSTIKKRLWDKEFSGEKWDFIDNTLGDCVYPYLEKYANGGDILDLGCGPGNTANELNLSTYSHYVGVDVSEAALQKAVKRTEQNGRTRKNRFVCSDFFGFSSTDKFDLILFRESMYHIPIGKIKAVLDRYSENLKPDGVFVVRLNTGDNDGRSKYRPTAMVRVVETEFDIVEKYQPREAGHTVLVFRPKHGLKA